MFKKLQKDGRGFTLIEVVIVLAIAAVIIGVVLAAVTNAQRSNRDSTRKQEASRLVSDIEQYSSNNGGQYPTAATVKASVTTYDSNLGPKYTFTAGGVYNANPTTWQTANNGSCAVTAGTSQVIYQLDTTTNRDYDLGICLEAGGLVMVHPTT